MKMQNTKYHASAGELSDPSAVIVDLVEVNGKFIVARKAFQQSVARSLLKACATSVNPFLVRQLPEKGDPSLPMVLFLMTIAFAAVSLGLHVGAMQYANVAGMLPALFLLWLVMSNISTALWLFYMGISIVCDVTQVSAVLLGLILPRGLFPVWELGAIGMCMAILSFDALRHFLHMTRHDGART